jgi:hypothetical protein
MRSGLFVIWQVDPESRINDRRNGYSAASLLPATELKVALIIAILRPSSHSSGISGVGVCDCFTIGVLDRVLLCPRISP